MRNTGHKFSCAKGLVFVFAVIGSLGLFGCHDWPDERGTAIEAQNILRDIARVETVADPNVPLPPMYDAPPEKIKQIVGGAEEWKLIYFCKYHTADDIKKILMDQFSSRIFDAKGKSQTLPNFGISASTGTNQLIIRCMTEADVDAVLEIAERADIPPIQVRVDCIVSELYADLTVDRETTILIDDLFGTNIKLGGKTTDDGSVLPAFPGASLRDPAREKFGLKVGVSGDDFKALVDILVSRGYLKILMNPSLEIMNGETAKIESKQHVPLQQISIRGGFGGTSFIESRTEYEDIIDSLEITPHVFADGFIGLETHAQIAAYLTPEGIKQVPIVTTRTITTKDNRIRHGESLIIGGIRKSEKRDVIRGVPILKDIPGLNLLFSGRDFEERATEVIFILTPTLSTMGRPNKEITEMLKERHESPLTQGLHAAVMDPLGLRARSQEQDRKLDAAVDAQRISEAEGTATRIEVMETGHQIETLQAEIQETKAQVEEVGTKADQAASTAEAAKAQVEAVGTKADQATSAAEAAKAQAEEVGTKADQAATTAEAAKTEAEKAASEAKQAKTQAQQATDEAQKAKSEAQKAKAEVDQARQKSTATDRKGKDQEKQAEPAQKQEAAPEPNETQPEKSKEQTKTPEQQDQKSKDDAKAKQ